MIPVLAVLLLVSAAVVVALLVQQRRIARRLLLAGARMDSDVVATGSGLAEATSVVERVVDRALLAGDDQTVAEARLAAALRMIPQGIVLFEPDGTIAFRNKVAKAYLSARHSDALVEEAILAVAEEVIATDGQSVGDRPVELFGPPRRTLVVRGFGVESGDDGPGALVVVEDVTERRRLESVRRDFVANISHELKTPVGALGLLAETLVSEDDPEVARRLAERILSEAFRVGRTIEDLLELSRIEVDESEARDDLPVRAVVADAVDRVGGAADQRGIEIVAGPVPERLGVVGDRRQLVSALYNLLENAVKYSDSGSIVEVRTETDGKVVDISVEDHGIGIPRRDIERVFERFYRVDRARSRDTGGTGLGLAIVRHIANNHHGEVLVTSEEGQGSTFTLRLPLGSGPVAVTDQAG